MAPLPLHDLLGALVAGVIDGEQQGARATLGFLREIGFVGSKSETDWGSLRFVTFSFEVAEANGKKLRTIRVPLLSLIPIPLQQVEEAEYEFHIAVSDIDAMDKAIRAKGVQLDSKTLLGTITSPPKIPPATDETPRVRVRLVLKQSDLPAGLASSLRRMEESSGQADERA